MGRDGDVSVAFLEVLPTGLDSVFLPQPKVEGTNNGQFRQCVFI